LNFGLLRGKPPTALARSHWRQRYEAAEDKVRAVEVPIAWPWLPGRGALDRKCIAALLGESPLNPLNADSGTLRGKRIVWSWRNRVGAVLYVAVLVAARFHPILRTCYARLLTAGNAKNVALTACLHTHLLILNAIVHAAIVHAGNPW
jgi:transposase